MSQLSSYYLEYLASPEWAEKRELVRHRCGGRCERCQVRRMRVPHHKTYVRLGHEWLRDLQGLCRPCHAFVHGRLRRDPAGPGARWRHSLWALLRGCLFLAALLFILRACA
jgi:hypothetical protein